MTTKRKLAHFLSSGISESDAVWRHYRLDPPASYVSGYDEDAQTVPVYYVVVSAANVPFSGLETYIFPADAMGKVVNWLEMKGSFRGSLDHAKALTRLGYDVV